MTKHNFTKLRAVPILDVARALRLQIARVGSKVWAMRDPHNPRHVTSLRIFEKNNTWHRFSGIESGGVHGGSVIDLVMHIHDCECPEACEFLTDRFL